MQSQDQDVCTRVSNSRYQKYMHAKYEAGKRSRCEILSFSKESGSVEGEHEEENGAVDVQGMNLSKPFGVSANEAYCNKIIDVCSCLCAHEAKGPFSNNGTVVATTDVSKIERGAAIRGRAIDGELKHTLELRDDEVLNCISTVSKDFVVVSKEIGLKELTIDLPQGYRVYDPEAGLCVTINAMSGGAGGKSGLYAVAQEPQPKKTLEDWLNIDFKIRRLTPKETNRLQGFPDNWNEKGIDVKGNEVKISDTQKLKQAGNAVTTVTISNLIKSIIDCHGGSLC